MLGFSTTGFAQTLKSNQHLLKSIPYEKSIIQSSSKEETILSYFDDDYGFIMGFGEDVPINATVCAYFPKEVISPYVGDTINKIVVNINNNINYGEVSSLKVCIWTDTINAFTQPVYEQEVDNIVDELNIVTLDQPYVLESEAIFIGYKILGKGYVLCAESNTSLLNENGYGDMFTVPDGQLKHAGDYGYGDFYIKAIIGKKKPLDIMLKEIIPNSFAVLGDNEVSGVVQNNGVNPITSYDVIYTIDGGNPSPIYSVKDVYVNNGGFDVFKHNVPAHFTTVGNHTIELEISNVNGGGEAYLDDNKIEADIQIVNEVFPQNVVCEEGTGTWCRGCPLGIVGFNTMEHEITDGTWIGIVIHNNDPMAMEISTEYFEVLGFSGIPIGKMNRNQIISPNPDSLLLAYRQYKNVMPPAKIEITSQTWNSETRDFTVDVGVNFISDMTSVDYGLSLIVVEDSIRGSGSGYAQSNKYSGDLDLIDWDGTNWKDLPNPVPSSQMVYNHVARQLIGGFDGISGIIPKSVNYGTAYSHTFSGNIPENHNELHTHLVALIIDNTDGHIVNATKVKLGDYDGVPEHEQEKTLNIYPNPSKGIITIDDVEDADITVYDILGKVVYTKHSATSKTIMDLSHLQSGNYLVRVINKDKFSSQKMIFIE